ncbi:helix-turn-helix domain-containing protein [Actinomadura yumaensis]|uniref:helix-turn-helix domain-containing protein n=1 Tax=Actinomadura yumaensis TaxID=111807 RepID=UPI003612FA79
MTSGDTLTGVSAAQLDSGMSKTLHNGLQILELLVHHPHGLSITEIAEAVGVHRTVAHRLVRTLEAHHLCRRDRFKRISSAPGWSGSPNPSSRTCARSPGPSWRS